MRRRNNFIRFHSHAGSGFSTPTHLTRRSLRFETRYGFSVAKSLCFTCTSQFQETAFWPNSVGMTFVKTKVPGPRSVKNAVPFRSVMTDITRPEIGRAHV